MKYAINIGDLTKKPILGMVFSDVLKDRIIVKAEKTMVGGDAVLINCDESRARAIIDSIRIKCAKHYLRCYESKFGRSWKRI